MKMFKKVLEEQFIKNIQDNNGEVYFVGGCVRDHFMNREIKDVDIVVTGIEIENLISILSLTGKADLVGESFGVIKYNTENFEFDIALPRKDTLDKSQKGHRAIVAQVDHNLPIEDDLKRRDFTINAMAFNSKLELIDIFGGFSDIQNKIIRCVDETAFVEDPLRILRAFQFSARFLFSIDSKTKELIDSNKSLLKDISGDRFFGEISKLKTPEQFGHFYELVINHKILEVLGYETGIFVDKKMVLTIYDLFKAFYSATKSDNLLKVFRVTNDIVKFVNATKQVYGNTNYELYKFLKASKMTIEEAEKTGFVKNIFNVESFKSKNFRKESDVVNSLQLMDLGFQGEELGKEIQRLVKNYLNY